MIPLLLANATHILAKDQPEFKPLYVMREEVDGVLYTHSIWEFTDEEWEIVKKSRRVQLTTLGQLCQPVLLLAAK